MMFPAQLSLYALAFYASTDSAVSWLAGRGRRRVRHHRLLSLLSYVQPSLLYSRLSMSVCLFRTRRGGGGSTDNKDGTAAALRITVSDDAKEVEVTSSKVTFESTLAWREIYNVNTILQLPHHMYDAMSHCHITSLDGIPMVPSYFLFSVLPHWTLN